MLQDTKRTVHTALHRQFIIERLAYGYAPHAIITKFRIRFPETDCREGDVHSCDPSIFVLSPEEHMAFAAAYAYAGENPELISPALDPVRRLISLGHMAESERERGAKHDAAKLYEQIAKEQAGFYAPKGVAKAAADSKDTGPASFTFGLDRVEQD